MDEPDLENPVTPTDMVAGIRLLKLASTTVNLDLVRIEQANVSAVDVWMTAVGEAVIR
jgi:hypothetical protein